VGLGLAQAEQAQVAPLLEDLVRGEDLGRLPLVHMRVDLLVDEALERLLDLAVLVRELHGACLRGRGGRENRRGKAHRYMRATPNCRGRSVRAAPSAIVSRQKASTARVSRGSMTPSSSSRPLVVKASAWASN